MGPSAFVCFGRDIVITVQLFLCGKVAIWDKKINTFCSLFVITVIVIAEFDCIPTKYGE